MGINGKARSTNNFGINAKGTAVGNVKNNTSKLGLTNQEEKRYQELEAKRQEQNYQHVPAEEDEYDYLDRLSRIAQSLEKYDSLPNQFTDEELREYARVDQAAGKLALENYYASTRHKPTDQEKKDYTRFRELMAKEEQLWVDAMQPVDWTDADQQRLNELRTASELDENQDLEYTALARKFAKHSEYLRTREPVKDLNIDANLSEPNRQLKRLLDPFINVDELTGHKVDGDMYFFTDIPAAKITEAYDQNMLGSTAKAPLDDFEVSEMTNENPEKVENPTKAVVKFLRKYPQFAVSGQVECYGKEPYFLTRKLEVTGEMSKTLWKDMNALTSKLPRYGEDNTPYADQNENGGTIFIWE